MKLFLFIAFAEVLLLQACNREPEYKISGTVADPVFEGAKVYLAVGDGMMGETKRDSTVVAGGRYTFDGVVAQPENGYIMVMHPNNWQKSVHISLAVENVDITAVTDNGGRTVVKGSAFNDAYQQYCDGKRATQQELTETVKTCLAKEKAGTFAPGEEKELRAKWDRLLREVWNMEYEGTKAHINNPAFWNELYNVGVSASLDEQKALLAAANERTLEISVVKQIAERVATLERTAIGQSYTDLRMNNPEGKEIALSDYVGKGKYVLVDFWASWCGPCRAEIPNVKAAYAKYKNKGLEIVGVSFDRDRDRWVKAIQDEQLPWPQMSDLKGRDSIGAKTYAITGIPHVLLLDKGGKIIARNLYGEELHRKLAELIK